MNEWMSERVCVCVKEREREGVSSEEEIYGNGERPREEDKKCDRRKIRAWIN